MAKPFQLGKGLGSLIQPKVPSGTNFWGGSGAAPTPTSASSAEQVQQLPLNTVTPNEHQPRQHFEQTSLDELVASIKTHGVLQPLIVRPLGPGKFELIAGERRFRAAGVAGLSTVPAIVREASEQQRLELALVENLQRQNLNPMEEAFAYRKLQDEFGLTQAKVAERVGKSRAQVANTERLLTLPPRIQAALTAGTITFGHAKVILGVESQAEQEKLFDLIVKEGLPVRFAEAKAGRVKVRGHERRVVSPELRAYEQELIQALGAKVKVRGTRDRGVVEVVFYSAQELAALVRKLRGQS